ncbi:putative DNA mismatch repair protein PMS1 [Glarea lozoyensis 74030]|uniref:Putative DNA mismatch repair protein PMS1 n=1 Tax=Glarea lozoyensis (strain ATCC 74030 / MF5533) TaxID=1104152 RepID=H0EEM6_GLAL7|nr:putative DNA mismatch repair protein PMS1 [Glarea lozoyensis 74030]
MTSGRRCHQHVRFKNQGLESIEVQDNGDGISPQNYETLALKHHTSKLATYSDLTTLQTFGFRGEALSSLVIGVLGQYACIQTGVKFSVSQQAGKGKKTSLFSTKGNKTTRENIVNVFGAKTLTALVPMDLKLKLEPTSGPSQRWSTQEDGGQKDIRIVGHISRPASGEGRTTPDRQMFFVNARPCGLPQVAKAFNEVYKAYNGSQSPFIFANIELDTHLYDVNVSPDKRTIMLHDQTRMLENLKEALVFLFDSQDYTVPISQLPVQKQPSYKQLTINRESSTTSKTSSIKRARSSSPSEASLGKRQRSTSPAREDEHDANPNDTGKDNSDDDNQSMISDLQDEHAASRRRLTKSSDNNLNLISNWAGRNTKDRSEAKETNSRSANVAGKLPKEKLDLLQNFRDVSQDTDDNDNDGERRNELASSLSTVRSSLPAPTFKLPVPVADFNTRIAEMHKDNRSEAPIPALESPSKSPPSLSSRFSSNPKTHRIPAEIATITIDGDTTTRMIGTPAAKSAPVGVVRCTSRNSRIHTPKPKNKAPLPSFGSRLSQRFGAPGTTQSAESDEDEDEDEDEEGKATRSPRTPSISSDPGEHDEGGEGFQSETQRMPINPSSDPVENNAIESSGELAEKPDSEANAGPVSELEAAIDDEDADDEYIDEGEKKAREEAKVQHLIQAAEEAAMQPSQANILRAKSLLKGSARRKESTLNIVKPLKTSVINIEEQISSLHTMLSTYDQLPSRHTEDDSIDSSKAEEKLSLTISKPDFAKMRIVGQFNLGFILATRTSITQPSEGQALADDLFIIDQHASDEKYNFERLQSTTIVQSQRLVHPKLLSLTALEEEIVLENQKALSQNGFNISFNDTLPVGTRCSLISLPLSRETVFGLEDLDELLALLTEYPNGSIPRPSKVRKMFAMRACRSSIMIGKSLSGKQMGNVVRHMGEIDKPWNCPHGRPTMRHLCGLGAWDQVGWKEGDLDGEKGGDVDLAGYVRGARLVEQEVDEDLIESEVEEEMSDGNEEILEEEIY